MIFLSYGSDFKYPDIVLIQFVYDSTKSVSFLQNIHNIDLTDARLCTVTRIRMGYIRNFFLDLLMVLFCCTVK
jgi:uncharacterized membrane protein YwzB